MTGKESNPASLFQLYVDYGRYTEATNLLLAYIESFASAVKSSLFSLLV
jgi:nuclear pore complex protein Nup160